MTGKNFMGLLLVLFTIAAVGYFLTMPRGNDIPLTGVIDGNEYIVSPQMTGRIVNLTVDEGSIVKKGDLIAELDDKELEASLPPPRLMSTSLEAQVTEANHNYSWTSNQTDASVSEAQARVTSAKAQLEQAHATVVAR